MKISERELNELFVGAKKYSCPRYIKTIIKQYKWNRLVRREKEREQAFLERIKKYEENQARKNYLKSIAKYYQKNYEN